jgi:hypothetical protein
VAESRIDQIKSKIDAVKAQIRLLADVEKELKAAPDQQI